MADQNYNQTHVVFLAIDQTSSLQTTCRTYGNPRIYYHYNFTVIEPALGGGDRLMYPMVHHGIETASEKDRKLKILFNEPDSNWNIPPDNGNFNNGLVHIRVESSPILAHLYKVAGYQLHVTLNGFLFRENYQDGLPIPLTPDHQNLRLEVMADGSSTRVTTQMTPGLLGLFASYGKFTVAVEWTGPQTTLFGAVRTAALLKWTQPDIKLFAQNQVSFACHFKVLTCLSSVMKEMLGSTMEGKEKVELHLRDVDPLTMEAFLKYAYDGNFHDAYSNSDVCVKLFSFANVYNVDELRNATQELLENKPPAWLSIDNALKLLCFATLEMHNGEVLASKMRSSIMIRFPEAIESDEFARLSGKYPALIQSLRTQPFDKDNAFAWLRHK